MLNKDSIRELAYVVIIDDITPIPNYDRIELAHIAGWTVVVGKDEFKTGDPAIYFEIDSKLPELEPFSSMEFLKSKKYKIKTQKMCKGTVYSQGLIVSAANLGWTIKEDSIIDDKGNIHNPSDESRFLTSQLNVTYAEPDDNVRKGKGDPNAKYKSMGARHKKLFSKKPIRWLMRRTWGKKLLFLFFGRKKDKPKQFPSFIKKTDEERCENCPWVLDDRAVEWLVTEKLDGTSSTYVLERKSRKKFEFMVCSRNLRLADENEKTYHEQTHSREGMNIYWSNAIKYDIKSHLKSYLNEHKDLKWVCLQGESVGSVQGNPLKLKEDDLYIFNFITDKDGRFPSEDGKKIIDSWGMKWVPVIGYTKMPETMEELKLTADGKSAVNPAVMREGFVYRTKDGQYSFKNVSREYLTSKK